MNTSERYLEFKNKSAKVMDLSFAGCVLEWDQQVYMPKNGGPFRAQQLATLKTLSYEMSVSKDYGDLLKSLRGDTQLSEEENQNVEISFKDYEKRLKYTKEFVEKVSLLVGESFTAWVDAKKTNKFSTFEPCLTKLVEFRRQEAEMLGYENHPYEALMDDFEPNLTVKKMDEVFGDVEKQLFPFLKQILAKQKPGSKVLHQKFPITDQRELVETIVKKMGYSFDSGRADLSPHPFSITLAPGDSRITLWEDENFLNPMLFAGIHEAGHALYEMGIPLEKHYGLPLGQALSMAFHESQSRLWENHIGRSLPFWKGMYPKFQEKFPTQLGKVALPDFFSAINEVKPTLIRVEADELSYHAHVYIRYQIEKALIEKSIQVKDIPAYWNEKYKQYLGITPPTDSEGCLQDVHWSNGTFGYFPTYSLGSFYAAQLTAQMKKENPKFDSLIDQGDYSHVLKWLREKVHVHGRKYNSAELLTQVTGSELKFSYFMDYVKEKYGKLYGV